MRRGQQGARSGPRVRRTPCRPSYVAIITITIIILQVRLKHRDTGAYLYSHVAKFGQPISGQQEACAWKEKDKNTEWQAAEGVYIPAAEGGEDGQAGSGAGSTSTGSEEEL